MKLEKIGLIHSPYDRQGKNKAPRQGENDIFSDIEIFKEYQQAIRGLNIKDEILVIYWADMAKRDVLISACPGRGEEKGVFALRSPHRPNPILFSKCVIEKIEDNIITVSGLEAIDRSSLVDIKISID